MQCQIIFIKYFPFVLSWARKRLIASVIFSVFDHAEKNFAAIF